MVSKVHVKKGDRVVVLNGKDKSKKGKVLEVFPATGKVIVEGVNITSKHKKPRSRTQQGGIIKGESPIDSSKVMLFCPRCSQPSRTGKKVLDNGQKARICKKCGEVVDIAREAKEEKVEDKKS